MTATRLFALFALFSLLFGAGGAAAQDTGPGVQGGPDVQGGPGGGLSIEALAGTGFTYQGELRSGGSPVNGNCDFQFSLWDSLASGVQQGSTQAANNVIVTAGRFTVVLNSAGQFGARAFDGSARWLAISVRCPAGAGGFTNLTPRQELTAAPLALALPGLRTEINATSPNVVGGYISNTVGGGVVGATIGGGGVSGQANSVLGDYGTVSGGYGNVAAGNGATAGGGYTNSAGGWRSVVGGGAGNTANHDYAVVAGGYSNAANTPYATVSGGTGNQAGPYAAVGGGNFNNAGGGGATIGGGYGNTANGAGATIGGGGWNGSSTVGNTATGAASTIGGGMGNTASLNYATVGGGLNNNASSTHAVVSGGNGNTASGQYSTVGGGQSNAAGSGGATVSGGNSNVADGNWATVGGGYSNTTSNFYAAVSGGYSNTASNLYAAVSGGTSNTASGDSSAVGGGWNNRASGYASSVPGGVFNTASGGYSFAAGREARAIHDGTFVWADSTAAPITSTRANQMLIRATGGVTIYTNSGATIGAAIMPGANAWTTVSDRNAKANFAPVDGVAILDALMGIRIETWNYNTQDASVRHIGPMAQDFYAAFGVGETEIGISTVDADGVALAAIQGLYAVVQEQQAENAALRERVAALEAGQTPRRAVSTNALPWLLLAGLGLLNAGGLAGYALARRGRGRGF